MKTLQQLYLNHNQFKAAVILSVVEQELEMNATGIYHAVYPPEELEVTLHIKKTPHSIDSVEVEEIRVPFDLAVEKLNKTYSDLYFFVEIMSDGENTIINLNCKLKKL